MKRKMIILILCICTFLINVIPAFATDVMENKGVPITIDGYYDDWADKPISYHYNWDNTVNFWNGGEWYNNVCYKLEKGTYDNNVRHIIQLYSDGQYIYVHIKIATIYGSKFNGEDYRFYFNNDQTASYQITDQQGNVITNNVDNFSVGIHPVQVRHRDGACSFELAENANAYLTVYNGYHNSDLEFKVPISACKLQNNNIDTKNIEVIKFFTPNLMYKYIELHGTPTFSVLLIAGCVIIVMIAQRKIIKNKKGE